MADLGGQPLQAVVLKVQRCQVLQAPQVGAEVANSACYLQLCPVGLLAGRGFLRRHDSVRPTYRIVFVLVLVVPRHAKT